MLKLLALVMIIYVPHDIPVLVLDIHQSLETVIYVISYDTLRISAAR